MTVRIINADVMDGLRQLPDESVHCVVTSPPYWGLRDYGTATWEGGEAAGCDHRKVADAVAAVASSTLGGGKKTTGHLQEGYRDLCGKCGARRIDKQIGLEATPQAFVSRMVEVFREVRRVLRPDGTCWVNLGDSYTSGGRDTYGTYQPDSKQASHAAIKGAKRAPQPPGLKPKDLVGIPWRVAFALQDDGWWLRQDIIWHKPNPMPESVTDRCTKAHEYVFHLTKSERYFWDHDAIKEDRASAGGSWVSGWAAGDTPYNAIVHVRDKGDAKTFRGGGKYTSGQHRTPDPVPRDSTGNGPALSTNRNKRSVWTIATSPFPEAHFATFPPELPEICIKAGCPVGGTVLDPFSGAGTTALVADRLQRHAIGIELNATYAAMSEARLKRDRGGLLDLMEAAE